MRKLILTLVILATTYTAHSQDDLYNEAYNTINEMLQDSTKYSFKKAVFEVEKAYHYGILDTLFLNSEINKITKICKQIIKQRNLKDYQYKDKSKVEKYASLYTVMTDTIPMKMGNDDYIYVPFSYDFNDIWGVTDWQNMFVSKLLMTGSGNCHSLPYLYKILAEEIEVDAHLTLAPNHIYIKHQSIKNGWYNTELTSGIFPNDSWIMASGYVHLDGIRNGLYMKPLTNRESIALILVDLAQGYEKRIPLNDGVFILKCLKTALNESPNLITALLMKLETNKKELERFALSKNKEINQVMEFPKGRAMWQDLNQQVRHITELGYRQMPKDMYIDWLVSLKTEKDKYTNENINTFKTKQ